tara:strand:+ start:500 stop:826 length:327 start_codon:yes stop_codon:yes gene_type:complete
MKYDLTKYRPDQDPDDGLVALSILTNMRAGYIVPNEFKDSYTLFWEANIPYANKTVHKNIAKKEEYDNLNDINIAYNKGIETVFKMVREYQHKNFNKEKENKSDSIVD